MNLNIYYDLTGMLPGPDDPILRAQKEDEGGVSFSFLFFLKEVFLKSRQEIHREVDTSRSTVEVYGNYC